MGRLFGFLLVVGLIALGGYYAASPWLAFRNLREAAVSGDADRLAALIDDKAVRESLKSQVDSEFTKTARVAAKTGWTPLEAAGKAGSMLGDRKVKKQIRADRIADLAAGDDSLAYLTPDTVRVTVAKPKLSPAAFLMERRSLFGWKVTKIVLPKAPSTRTR